ncbi:hypothetical protein BKN38_01290 [Helicobacter sp. CLO-3]|uniref:YggT family protein n=1 Tax=unclassified Helicobacter TaxID=2593540 RepID=UPI0008054F38|nr:MULTISPECIES: YggT family protein [unclassified Helicobacter]OBV29748.1 hypothetical protein BA723_00095 [Helicobacter sp. CLO-3]OHU85201.1 hypothetical protein BKN38_01290 [Helicobacter sp. CLO-3]
MSIIINALAQTLHMLIWAYMWIIIIAVFLSWVRPDPSNPIVQVIYRLSYPLLDFVRRKLPFLVINGIDLSPLVVVILLQVIDQVLMQVLLQLAR